MANYTLDTSDFSKGFHIFGLVRTATGLYTYVDNDSNRVLDIDWSQESFYERGGWDSDVYANPWAATGKKGTPFVDEPYHLILNVAVGGVSTFFPDDVGNKPWSDSSSTAMQDFWEARNDWLDSWENSDAPSFKIDWIKVTDL